MPSGAAVAEFTPSSAIGALMPWYPELGLTGFWLVAVATIYVLIIVTSVVVIPRNRRPTTALAWIITIILIPYLGVVLFFLFGTNQLPTRRRRMQAQVDGIIRDATDQIAPAEQVITSPSWFAQVTKLGEHLTAIPLADGNRLELHGTYNRAIRRMADEIDEAESYVNVLFYAMSHDEATAPFFDALERAVQRGVTVRVLFDHVGSMRYRGYKKMKHRLTQIGADWHRMLSLYPWQGGMQRVDLRNHRKLLVVDGRTAYLGSQNLISRDYHRGPKPGGDDLKWKDLMLRMEGPMVTGVNAVFISDWYAETEELLTDVFENDPVTPEPDEAEADIESGDQHDVFPCQLVPSGPGYENENNLRLFNQLLYAARERIVIVSPYFVPDDSLMYAITTAVQRGVSVELFVGEIADQFFVFHAQRSYYETLLRAGVRIMLYRRPYILHSKHITFDDSVTLIGSSNMDMRSFTLNAELMLMVHGEEFVNRMREVENGYRQRSFELTLDEWRQRPILTRALDNVARLTSVIQ